MTISRQRYTKGGLASLSETMEILSIGKLNFESFTPFVDIREQPMQEYPWTQVDAISFAGAEGNRPDSNGRNSTTIYHSKATGRTLSLAE
jgi:hypothetical protein